MSNSDREERVLSPRGLWAARIVFGVMAGVILLFAAISPAHGQLFRPLYSFTGVTDGGEPAAGVSRDAKGNLYGAAYVGGNFNSNCSNHGCGLLYKLDKNGKETVLYSFNGGSDGANPAGRVIRDGEGNLYSTTTNGGGGNCPAGPGGCGTVFKVSKSGQETVLYAFAGGSDGFWPQNGVVQDAQGNLYGTTPYGGDLNGCNGTGCGTVFKVTLNGVKTLLYSFTGGADGAWPMDSFRGLILDAKGNLYGTTEKGGANDAGVVFKVNPKGQETVLYSFGVNGTDAYRPEGDLIRDAKGNFYGSTYFGGSSGNGAVFKIDTTGKEIVLYSFTGGTDGEWPYGGVTLDRKGNLYGTTLRGGDPNDGGFGVVFKINKTGQETVLYTFTGSPDGAYPYAAVILTAKRNLYGTTAQGSSYGYGEVWEIKP